MSLPAAHPLSTANKRKSPPRSASHSTDDFVQMGNVSSVTPNNTDSSPSSSNKPPHIVTAGDVVHTADGVLFSTIKDHKLGLTLVWSDWTTRTITLYKNAYLSYGKKAGSKKANKEYPSDKQLFYLVGMEVKLMGDVVIDGSENDAEETVHGVVVKCRTLTGVETYIRCVLALHELNAFLGALQDVTGDESLALLQKQSLQHDASKTNVFRSSTNAVAHLVRRKMGLKLNHHSVMRHATARAMDKYDRRTKNEKIIAKRGAFKYLPVMGNNDLIHGSVWFTLGSVGIVFTAVFVVVNKYFQMLSDDDSALSRNEFVDSWILLAISGVFSTFGELLVAFVNQFVVVVSV
jgi:hypothetical protein